MERLKIGMFDSGIGGFTILREVQKLLPCAQIHYIADDEFAPYGTKTVEQIVERSKQNCDLLLSRGAQMIVVACNSATAAAIEQLRNHYSIPFVGVEPYINILNHLEKIPEQKTPKCAVITTELTGKSPKFLALKNRLDPENKIDHFKLKNLATLIEKAYAGEDSDDLIAQINLELDPIKNGSYQYLILGCTHYPLIKNYIERYLSVTAVCPGAAVAKQTLAVAAKHFNICDDGIGTSLFDFLQTTNRNWVKLGIEKTNQLLLSYC